MNSAVKSACSMTAQWDWKHALIPVLVGNSDSNILMVQAAQHWDWEHASHRPHGARDRRMLLQR
jgi:hypothetical protein